MGILNSLRATGRRVKNFLGNLAEARAETAANSVTNFNANTDKAVNAVLAGDPDLAPIIKGATKQAKRMTRRQKRQAATPVCRALRRDKININNNSLRNRDCSCGSGKKYKECCLAKRRIVAYQTWLRMTGKLNKAA